MRLRFAPFLLLLTFLFLGGCGSSAPRLEGLPGTEGDFDRAKKTFDQRNWLRAIELLNEFVDSHPGSNQLDQALLMLGLSQQHTKEYLLAIGNFERLIRDFSQSPLREQAEFERANSYLADAPSPPYDSENTETAFSLLRAYLAHYPDGAHADPARRGVDTCLEKLATKALLNGETYVKLQRDAAAVIYFEKAIQTKPDFGRAGDALADLARACERLGDRERARIAWQSLVDYATPERTSRDSKLLRFRREAEDALRRLPSSALNGATAP